MSVTTPATTPEHGLIVLWFTGHDLLERTIEHISRSPYCHVAVFWGGCCWEEQEHGLVTEAGDAAIKRAEQAAAYRVVPLTAAQETLVGNWFRREVHTPYNLAMLALDALGDLTGHQLILAWQGDYVCSGATADLLSHLGYLWPKDDRAMSPGDLARDPQLAPVQLGAPPAALLTGVTRGT